MSARWVNKKNKGKTVRKSLLLSAHSRQNPEPPSFVQRMGINGYNFKNETFFVHFAPSFSFRNGKIAQTLISDIEQWILLKYLAIGLSRQANMNYKNQKDDVGAGVCKLCQITKLYLCPEIGVLQTCNNQRKIGNYMVVTVLLYIY